MDPKQQEATAPPPAYNEVQQGGQYPGYPPPATGYPAVPAPGYPPQAQAPAPGYPQQPQVPAPGYPQQPQAPPGTYIPSGGGYAAQQYQYPAQPMIAGQQTVIVGQPTVIAAPYKPPNNMILAVIVTLFCNLCCGIAAIIFSNQSDVAFNNGDVEEARRKGETSKKISIAAIACGVGAYVLLVILYFTVIVTNSTRYY